MSKNNEDTIILGDEYDDKLRQRLLDCLKNMGAKIQAQQFSVGGSQEIETLSVEISGDIVIIEAETFIGLSVTGPSDLVKRISQSLA